MLINSFGFYWNGCLYFLLAGSISGRTVAAEKQQGSVVGKVKGDFLLEQPNTKHLGSPPGSQVPTGCPPSPGGFSQIPALAAAPPVAQPLGCFSAALLLGSGFKKKNNTVEPSTQLAEVVQGSSCQLLGSFGSWGETWASPSKARLHPELFPAGIFPPHPLTGSEGAAVLGMKSGAARAGGKAARGKPHVCLSSVGCSGSVAAKR